MSENKKNVITRHYRCPICNTNHKIKLSKEVINGHTKFPFPYVILHDSVNNNEFKEVLTILYIDKDRQIRATEIQELRDDNLFSKRQVVSMTQTFMEENKRLREDVERLTKELNDLKSK